MACPKTREAAELLSIFRDEKSPTVKMSWMKVCSLLSPNVPFSNANISQKKPRSFHNLLYPQQTFCYAGHTGTYKKAPERQKAEPEPGGHLVQNRFADFVGIHYMLVPFHSRVRVQLFFDILLLSICTFYGVGCLRLFTGSLIYNISITEGLLGYDGRTGVCMWVMFSHHIHVSS